MTWYRRIETDGAAGDARTLESFTVEQYAEWRGIDLGQAHHLIGAAVARGAVVEAPEPLSPEPVFATQWKPTDGGAASP